MKRLLGVLLLLGGALRAAAQPAAPGPQGPAFPLMMYEASPSDAQNLTNYGWQVIQSYGLNTTNAINSNLQGLAGVAAQGIAVIPATLATNSGNGTTYAVEWPQSQVAAWVEATAGNTNLAWWSLPEEMRSWVPSELQLLGDYTAWTRADDPKQRPAYEYTPNNRAASEIARIVPSVDVLGLSCYCELMGMPHAWVRYKLQEAGLHGIALAGRIVGTNYLAGEKTPIAVLYCGKAAGMNAPTNMPSPSQSYHDFWSAIASGARGIAVYAYWHALHDDPTLVTNLQQLNLAASQLTGPERLGEAFLYGTPNTNVSFGVLSGPSQTVAFQPPSETNAFQYPSLNLLCKSWMGSVYLLGVNSTGQSVSARISNLPSVTASATLPLESRSVPVANGVLADTFPPWGVHLYKLPASLSLDAFTLLSAGRFRFVVTNCGVTSFTMLGSANLRDWSAVGMASQAGPGVYQFTDTAPQSSVRYYQARWP